MTAQPATRRQFRMERLEDRVAPNSLLWQGGLVEVLVGTGALNAGFPAQPLVSASTRIAALRLRTSSASETASPAVPTLPLWAESLLLQIEQELEKAAAPAGEPVSVAQQDQADRLDALMAQVDEGLCHAVRPAGETMPAWAEDLLLEIQQEVAQSARCRTSRPRAGMAVSLR